MIKHVWQVASSFEQLIKLYARFPTIFQSKGVHSNEYNTLVKEDLTQWIPVVIEHYKATVVVSVQDFWKDDITLVLKIIFQMFKAKYHSVLARKSNFITEVSSSFIDEHR